MIAPTSRIGILGGGQLGRMLAQAGAKLGLDVVIFEPEADCPASRVAANTITAPYTDLTAVAEFAKSVDAITYEFENVPIEAALEAARHAPLRPGTKALEVSQDRLIEKTFLNEHGAPTVAFIPVETKDGLALAFEKLSPNGPTFLKTRRNGYDGKGQVVLKDATAAKGAAALELVAAQPTILEAFAPFKRELSIIAARGNDGQVRAYPLGENRHEGGILRQTLAPAEASDETRAQALRIATNILNALDYVGVLAVELFELDDGRLLVNEIAPRVHNSGHWTQQGCLTDQFEQHMRAVAGWPLGDPEPIAPVRMVNLIGSDGDDWQTWLKQPGAVLHLYGKRQTRPGRKMGHVNIVERG